MRTSWHIAFTLTERYDVLYNGEENDNSVGSGLRRRILDWYEFCFSISLWQVFEIELCHSVVFSVVRMVLWNFDPFCTYHSDTNYYKPSCYTTFSQVDFYKVWLSLGKVRLFLVMLEVQSARCFALYFIFHTAFTADACALTSILPPLSLINIIYRMADTKATTASVQCVSVNFVIHMDLATPQRCETCS
jgi:hypothetical protein